MSRLVALGTAAAERLAEVHASAFDRPWGAADLADMVAGLGASVLGLEEAGRLVGFVLFQAAGGEAEILTLAVRPEARGRGIGRGLVEAAALAAVEAGAATLWLEVADDNEAALGLYRAAGFAPAGRRRAYYRRADGGRADALVMRRTLNTGPA